MKKFGLTAVFIATVIAPHPAFAGWKYITPTATDVGRGTMTVTPSSDWNRWSRRESTNGETWTKDGFQLNRIDFSGQVTPGEPLYKERQKREKPMPKFETGMLPTDIADLYESSFRLAYNVTQFNLRSLESGMLGTNEGIRLTFDYAVPGDALTRLGEARLAVKDGRLYMIGFVAPELHYYDESIAEIHAIMDSVVLR